MKFRFGQLAAAVVLLAGANLAAAQSVTIYGLLDLGIQKSDGEATSASWRNGPASKVWSLEESKGSRLGFQGKEDLGGGLSAEFQIEHRFSPDTGTANNTFWAGRSYVQLGSKQMGSVYLGREYTPYRNVAEKNDPFGQDGVGKFDSRAYAYFGGSRTANTVGYKTPNFGGVKAQIAVSLGEGSATTPRETSFNVEYASGPLYVGVAYSQQDNGAAGTATRSGDGSKLYLIGANYNFGFIKPMFTYSRSETGINGNLKNNFVLVGGTAPIGPGLLKFGYGRFDPSGGGNVQQKFAVGYDYPLSKRTKLYVDYANSRQKGLTGGVAFKNYNVFALGMQHKF